MSQTAFESGLFLTAPGQARGAIGPAAGASVLLHAAFVGALILAPLSQPTNGPEVASSFRGALTTPVIAPPAPAPEASQPVRTNPARAAAAPSHAPLPPEHEASRFALVRFVDPTAPEGPSRIEEIGDPRPGDARGNPCVPGTVCDGPIAAADPTPQQGTPRVGGSIAEPRLREGRAPVYPPLAIAAGVSGLVIIEAHVLQDGRVHEARVLRGHELFDEAALVSVRSRRYEPLRLNGIPTDFLITITVNFTLRR